jgi:penicillin-binding protein 2
LILGARLFELQVIKGAYYRELSEENRIRHSPIPAARGKIFARGGEIIDGKKFAHITGFVAEANEDEVGKIDPKCPEFGPRKLSQLVGRGGINEEYNCILMGIDGEELVEVDTSGKKIRTLGIRNPIPGKDVRTTIDFGLQNKVAESMEEKVGAAVVTDKNGEVLAFYSNPSFDPKNVKDYLEDKDLPFFNRVIGGLYHPGSVFKPIVAISALEEGSIDKNYRFTDTGVLEVKTLYGDFSYSNWYLTQYGGTEGTIDLTRAIARSTDTFFYTIGEMVGPEKIAEYADRFGLNKKTGIDIPGEIAGLIPTPEWKKEVKNENWFLGNTYHLSIGQGDVAVTPLELNQAIAAISTGRYCRPHLVGDQECKNLGIDEKNLDLVREGMRQVCQTGGTGYTFFDFPTQVYCKTGTAEVGLDGDTHAWFTLFDEDITLTVLIEKGGEGSKVAGPVAREIMNFTNLQKNP